MRSGALVRPTKRPANSCLTHSGCGRRRPGFQQRSLSAAAWQSSALRTTSRVVDLRRHRCQNKGASRRCLEHARPTGNIPKYPSRGTRTSFPGLATLFDLGSAHAMEGLHARPIACRVCTSAVHQDQSTPDYAAPTFSTRSNGDKVECRSIPQPLPWLSRAITAITRLSWRPCPCLKSAAITATATI